MAMSWLMRLLLGTTKLMPCSSMKRPTMRGMRAFQHFHHRTLAAAAAIEAQHAGQSTVAMQHAAHLLGREEQIVAALVVDEESETVGMTHHAAAHQILFLREAVIALAVDDELAVALHGAQPAAQRRQVSLAAEAQRSGDLLERGGLTMLSKMLQDKFAAGDR